MNGLQGHEPHNHINNVGQFISFHFFNGELLMLCSCSSRFTTDFTDTESPVLRMAWPSAYAWIVGNKAVPPTQKPIGGIRNETSRVQVPSIRGG